MKILLLLSHINQTGLTTNTLDLTNGLVEKEHDVYVLIGKKKSEEKIERLIQLQKEFEESGANIIYFRFPIGGKFSKLTISIMSSIFILYKVLSLKADIIHVESPYMSFLPWLLRKKFTSTMHVTDFVRKFQYKNATHLIAISRETKEYSKSLFEYVHEDISVVPHGISKKYSERMSTSETSLFKEIHNIPKDKIIIGMVGSIEPRKGHEILIKAVSRLDVGLQQKVHLVLVGSDKRQKNAEEADLLDALIDKYNISNIITKLEYRDPKKFYDIMDIFVFPSFSPEGFGLVVIEAMMSECCVIRTDSEGAYDSINDGKDGLIFEQGNVDQLSDLLEEMLTNSEQRRLIASNARERALEYFSIEAMTERTLNVYKKIL